MERMVVTACRTRSGALAEDSFVKLHEYIMNGNTDEAVSVAFDLYRTSTGMLKELWKRLEILTVYHVGLETPEALAYLYNIRCICYDSEPYMPDMGGMQALCFIHVIRYLCKCRKEHSLEGAILEVQASYKKGEYAKIPSFAKDHHNHVGREQGHTPLDFLYPDGGSLVIPEAEGAASYRKKLIELLMPVYGGDKPKPFRSDSYNHFYEMESPHGLNQELLQSAFQKTIRRAMEQEALMITFECFLCGQELEEYLWERIVIMSVEDVGMGEPECNRYMYAYYKIREQFLDCDEIRLGLLMQAVRILCRCPKERGTELIKGILVQESRKRT